jgi:hypothetical protein
VSIFSPTKPARPAGNRVQGFGRALEQARIAGGISLDEAAIATRISPRYLLALEQEEINELPAPIYARGFLRSYAGYLGLDAASLTALYPVPYVEPALEPVVNPRPIPIAPPRTLTYIAAGGLALVVFILGIVLLTSGGDSPSTPSTLPEDPSGAATTEGAGATQDNAQPAVPASGTLGNYVGQDIAIVRDSLFNLGVAWAETQQTSEQPIGTVLSQSLPEGTNVEDTTALTIVWSSGPASP